MIDADVTNRQCSLREIFNLMISSFIIYSQLKKTQKNLTLFTSRTFLVLKCVIFFF